MVLVIIVKQIVFSISLAKKRKQTQNLTNTLLDKLQIPWYNKYIREGKLLQTRKGFNMKISKAIVDSNIRTAIFNALNVANIEGFHKINDRQYGCIVEDVNGERRYARLGVIVAEQREEMTADELMAAEIADYNAKQEKKAAQVAARAEKAAKDKAKREAAKKEKEGE